MGNNIDVPIAYGLDISNCFKDVPNFMKYIPNFVKDVPRVPKFVPMWGMTFNHYLKVLKG